MKLSEIKAKLKAVPVAEEHPQNALAKRDFVSADTIHNVYDEHPKVHVPCWTQVKGPETAKGSLAERAKERLCIICQEFTSVGQYRKYKGVHTFVCDACYVGPKYKEGKYFLDTPLGAEEMMDTSIPCISIVKPRFVRQPDGHLGAVGE